MKTNYFINRKLSMYSLLGFVALIAASCGSYQNSSYYDSDGIYHTSGKPQNAQATNNPSQGNQYKDYFSSLQNDDTQIFTDVDNYYTPIDTTVQNNQEYSTGNAGWGDSASNISVSIGAGWGYGMWNYWYSPYWGYNSWYGPYWGLGWYGYPYYGYGYPYYGYGYGCYYPYYGHYNNNYYAYNGGRRGSTYSNGTRNNSVRSYSTNGGRSYTSYNNGGRRNSPTFTGTRSTTTPRYTSSTRSYPQNNTGVRQSTSQPTRTYSPNTSGGGRSSGGSYGGGGGSYGGGGGGGRSGGGGGGRR